jgi:hypothetical protein
MSTEWLVWAITHDPTAIREREARRRRGLIRQDEARAMGEDVSLELLSDEPIADDVMALIRERRGTTDDRP